jgi:hypothetical protein
VLPYLLLLACAASEAATQVALVIGNQAYADAPLANPANDARAVGAQTIDVQSVLEAFNSDRPRSTEKSP